MHCLCLAHFHRLRQCLCQARTSSATTRSLPCAFPLAETLSWPSALQGSSGPTGCMCYQPTTPARCSSRWGKHLSLRFRCRFSAVHCVWHCLSGLRYCLSAPQPVHFTAFPCVFHYLSLCVSHPFLACPTTLLCVFHRISLRAPPPCPRACAAVIPNDAPIFSQAAAELALAAVSPAVLLRYRRATKKMACK